MVSCLAMQVRAGGAARFGGPGWDGRAREPGIEETACQLQVNAERLEQRVEQMGLLGGSNGSASAEFVELSPMLRDAPGECQVEVEAPHLVSVAVSGWASFAVAGRRCQEGG
jgi:hypothetical protein